MNAHQHTDTASRGHTSRGDHTLNVRMLWFRGRVEREEPAMLALDLLSQERADDALDVALAALERSPRDPELLLVAARAHLMRGEILVARDVCIEAAREGKDWAEAFAWLARILTREGRSSKAAEVAERAVLLGATDRDLAIIEGPRRAARLLTQRTRAFLSNPDRDEPALLSLALEAAGRVNEALTVIELGLRRDPGDEDLLTITRRLRGVVEDTGSTSIDLEALSPELDDEAREAAFFASLGIKEKPVMRDEPSVIVSDTMVGEPAPRVHAAEIAIPVVPRESKSSTLPLLLTQRSSAPKKRSGWLPKLGERQVKIDERLPGMPPATVRTAPIARVARRDPTVRFWLGR